MLKKKRHAKQAQNVLPTLSVLLTCDGISRDPNSGKPTLYGIFDRIFAKEVPAAAQFNIYARMSGASGHHVAILEFTAPNGKKISPDSSGFEFDATPNACIEMQMQAVGFELPMFGDYKLSVKCDGKVIGSCPVHVLKSPVKQ